jgi:hypothetical protein
MRTLGTAAVLSALLGLSACGSQAGSSAPDTAGCVGQGTVVARADLDGKGQPTTVRLTGSGSGPCADLLLADGGASAEVGGLDLVPKQGTVVHLHGADAPDLVLLSSQPHPRGGWQPHLFGSGGETGLIEVTSDGRPVVPFVATDGGAPPMTATCTPEGGIALVTAVAHEPPGVVLAWDVTETTYTVKDGRAETTGSKLVEEAAADPLLRRERPELFDGTLFANCD